MHFVTLTTAKTLAFDLPIRPDSSGATFVVKSPSGGIVQASTSATRGTVDTTLNGATLAGAATVAVTSATGLKVGKRYIIGATGSGTSAREDLGGEVVTVKSINGTTITPVVPLRLAHASGESFQSREITCVIGATIPSAVGRHWRVEVTYSADDGTAASSVAQPVHVESFDVVRYTPVTTLSFADIAALDPVITKRLPAGFWFPAMRDACWDMILRRVAAKVDPGALVGVVNLTTAHSYLVRAELAETGGTDADRVEYRNQMMSRFNEEFDAAVSTGPVDNDQDGAVEENEGVSMHTIDLRRG
jgi:hypothetical protein